MVTVRAATVTVDRAVMAVVAVAPVAAIVVRAAMAVIVVPGAKVAAKGAGIAPRAAIAKAATPTAPCPNSPRPSSLAEATTTRPLI